ncbi:MAG TPA: 5-formyltetrahydrofolate cyclo-ligase [Candidatus Limnocylindrales bacterium]|nr:5-formyltetrahydrofolate cyclo-ligase [Candidatus Limnocylindrales bacterium]
MGQQDPQIAESKRRFRREIQRRLQAIQASDAVRRGHEISEHLTRTPEFAAASFVAGYVSLADEVRVDLVLAEAVVAGKPLLLPVLQGQRLLFAQWRPCSPLHRDVLGVLEPMGGAAGELPPGQGVLVVPGRAFDLRGNRLGRGSGFYDRILARRPAGLVAIGVAFLEQIVPGVPAAVHDLPVDALVTDDGIHRCDGSPGSAARRAVER